MPGEVVYVVRCARNRTGDPDKLGCATEESRRENQGAIRLIHDCGCVKRKRNSPWAGARRYSNCPQKQLAVSKRYMPTIEFSRPTVKGQRARASKASCLIERRPKNSACTVSQALRAYVVEQAHAEALEPPFSDGVRSSVPQS